MDRHVEAFLEMLAAERGAAHNTLLAYQADLDDLAGFAAARGQSPADRGLAGAHQPDQDDAASGECVRQWHRFLEYGIAYHDCER